MAAKGKAKGLSLVDIEKQKKLTKQQYENAYDNSYYCEAQMKNGQWHLARIIDYKFARDYDMKKKKTEASYEYYVHYEKFNRRMDEWVVKSRIRMTDRLVEEEPPLKKKKKAEEKKDFEENDEHEGMDEASLKTHQEVTKVKTISEIEIGKYRCETWYYSPYPQGYHSIECLYLCEFCLSFYLHKQDQIRHSEKCPLINPPGNEIYRHDRNSIFEVDGQKNPTYCENLCYLSKLFLDHKNLTFDTEPFLFYVLTENDEFGFHFVGYFSKEKESTQGFNLSCILTMPFHQRKGYGKFLISFSYELSLKEQKNGTPERPLSDLGRQSYLSWWSQRIIEFIKAKKNEPFSLNDITKETGIIEKDILFTLEEKQLIKYNQGQIYICTDEKHLERVYKEAGRPGLEVVASKIHWVPFKLKFDQVVKSASTAAV